MNTGLSFLTLTDDLIRSFTEILDVDNYIWYLDDEDDAYNGWEDGLLSGEQIKQFFLDIDPINFFRLRRYPKNAVITNIDTLDDYLQSECDFIIIYYDNAYVDLYAKDIAILNFVYEQCLRFHAEKMFIETLENPVRTDFHAC